MCLFINLGQLVVVVCVQTGSCIVQNTNDRQIYLHDRDQKCPYLEAIFSLLFVRRLLVEMNYASELISGVGCG